MEEKPIGITSKVQPCLPHNQYDDHYDHLNDHQANKEGCRNTIYLRCGARGGTLRK